MKIVISAKPVFTMIIDTKTVELIMKISAHHYDAKCRAASWRDFPRRGFLAEWLNYCKFNDEPDTIEDAKVYPTATVDQLDTTLKICEPFNWQGMGFSLDERKRLLDFIKVANLAFKACRRVDWQSITVDGE